MPNSRFALHGERPSPIHGLCAFFASNSRFMHLFQAALDTCLDSPCFASLSVHSLHFGLRALDFPETWRCPEIAQEFPLNSYLGARLRGRTATQRSKIRVLRRFWEGFWGRGSRKGSEKGACCGFYSKKGSEKGSEKGF